LRRSGPFDTPGTDVGRHTDVRRLLEETKSDALGIKKVRDKMFEKKFGARADRYLAGLRRQAMIEYK
jgi:hypothetical protein